MGTCSGVIVATVARVTSKGNIERTNDCDLSYVGRLNRLQNQDSMCSKNPNIIQISVCFIEQFNAGGVVQKAARSI